MNILSLFRILVVCYFFVTSYSASLLHDTQSIRSHLKRNKPVLKTIQSPDGDVIDCVPTHQQPAFDHPLLKGQKPLDPPEILKWHNSTGQRIQDFQLWRMSGELCPKGTIPIRRTTKQDMLRAQPVQRFRKKLSMHATDASNATQNAGHEYAIGSVYGGKYYGGMATINVWDPIVSDKKELSTSQIWLASEVNDQQNTIEVGWQVNPSLYDGEVLPRLFIYWTADNYNATGCYDLLCPGFVQTSGEFAFGTAMNGISSYDGEQFTINVAIYKDPDTGHWWLTTGLGLTLGYWPYSLFNQFHYASTFDFGGDIYNYLSSGHHTETQMGSGHFSSGGFKKASYFKDIRVYDENRNLYSPSNIDLIADHPDCYDIQKGSSPDWEEFYFYGGPGRNENCP